MTGARSGGTRARGLAVLLLFLTTLAYAAGPASAQTRLSETRRKLQIARARLTQVRRSDAQLLAIISSLGNQLDATRSALAAADDNLMRITALIGGEERHLERLDVDRQARASLV